MLRRLWFVALAFAVVLPFGSAVATTEGSSHSYSVVGYTPDGKYVYFKKSTYDGYVTEEDWLAVYDATTGKRVTSKAVRRSCDEGDDEDGERDDCEGGRPISKKAGAKAAAKLHKKYGAPSAGAKLKSSSKKALPGKKEGSDQLFKGKDIKLRAITKQRGKLVDPMFTGEGTASFSLEVTVTAGKQSLTGKRKVRAEPIEDPDNGNMLLWPELYVQQIVVSPTKSNAALVFGRRPFIVQLE